MRSIPAVVAALLTLLPLSAAADPSPPQFAVTDLGTLGGAQTEANAINSRDQIVGEADTAAGNLHAFLWQTGHIQDLGTLGGNRSVAEAINEKGQVVGEASCTNGHTHAFLWETGQMRDLGTLGGTGSTAACITSDGTVVGFADRPGNKERVSFIWTEQGGMRELPAWIDVYSSTSSAEHPLFVASLPDRDGKKHLRIGQITGGMARLPMGIMLKDTDLPLNVVALNSRGHALGENFFIGINGNYSRKPRAYFWTASSLIDLGSLSGQEFVARRINDQDEVVGLAGVLVPGATPYLSGASPEDMHAFLWKQGVLRDLNTLIAAEEGWVLWDALGLNHEGQIVGTGLHHGKQHAFLLTPYPSAPAS